MTVLTARQTLESLAPSLPLYVHGCALQRIDAGVAVINLTAPRIPGNPPETTWTVGTLLQALTETNEENILFANGHPVAKVYTYDDGSGPFADIVSANL